MRAGLNALGWLLSMGLTVSGLVIPPVGYTLLALMLPVSVWTFWPWIKRVRVGLAPLDAELRQALEARDRWRENFERGQREIQTLNTVRERQLEKIRELEQERDALRAENEGLIAESGRFGVQSGDGELKQRCRELSAKLFRFAQERDEKAPPEATLQMSGGFWDAIKESIADPKTQERTNYDNETRRLYSELYGGDVGALLDALERREWLDAEERKKLEDDIANEFMSPTPPIRQLAQRLAAIGNRL